MDGRTDGWMDGWTDERTKVLLCSTGFCPLRGRCPASSSSNILIQSRAMGTAYHILPLGDWFPFFPSFSPSFSSISRSLFFSFFPSSFPSPPCFFPFLPCLPATFGCFLRAPLACSRTLSYPASGSLGVPTGPKNPKMTKIDQNLEFFRFCHPPFHFGKKSSLLLH